MKRFRQSLLTWTAILLLSGAANSFALSAEIAISSAGDLSSAIARFNSTGESLVLKLSGTITLTEDLPIIQGNGENSLQIVGGTINGGGTCRGLIIDSGDSSVSVDGTSFTSCVAKGGNGGSGAIGGGGGMGAGGAIYAKSGDITLKDVTLTGNAAAGGNGGNVLYQSNTYGGGGGVDGNGGGGSVGDSLANPNGNAGSGGSIGPNSNAAATTQTAGVGGGYVYTATDTRNQSAHYEDGITGIVGGDGGYGGGGAGSVYVGGDGGVGGGGGAGTVTSGSGGFGAGGAGGSSTVTAGVGGFGGGNGGYQATETSTNFSDTTGGGTGGGGAGLGGALYVEQDANVHFIYSTDSTIANNLAIGGAAGIVAATGATGTATAGTAIGSGMFLKDDVTIEVGTDATLSVNNSIGGYGTTSLREGGIIKEGEGTLALNASSSYTGDTIVNNGLLTANASSALSQYSRLIVNGDSAVQLTTDQSVLDLQGSAEASVDLGGKKLTILAGGVENEIKEYAGSILSNGQDGTGGTLEKKGTGTLYLTGNNSSSDFAINIDGGTIRAMDGSALGIGNITYSRSDITDIGKALAFDNSATVSNNIILNGNVGAMRIGTSEDAASDVEINLAGRIVANSTSTGKIQVDMNSASQILRLSNTGILPTGTYSSNIENSFSNVIIKRGTLLVDSTRIGDLFYSGLGSATVTNTADGNTFRIASTESEVFLKNDFSLDGGLLTLENGQRGQNLNYYGTFTGNGGININMADSNDILDLSGTFNYTGETKITNGVLDISNAAGSTTGTVNLTGLSSNKDTGNASLIVGSKNLQIGDENNHYYKGVIASSLTPSEDKITIGKIGTGNTTLSLATGSDVGTINIKAGTLTAEDNTLSNVAINIKSGGTFGVDGNISHGILDTSVKGSGLLINEGSSLNLLGNNVTLDIVSNLSGNGTLILEEPASLNNEWTLSGANGLWSGTVQTSDNSMLVLNSSNAAGNAEGTIMLGSNAKLSATVNQGIGHLQLSDNNQLSIVSGKTLTVNELLQQSASPGTLEIVNGGMLLLKENAAKGYTGATNVKNSVLKVVGNNVAEAGTRGDLTLENATLSLDYSGMATGDKTVPFGSIWGNENITVVDDGGGINVYGAKKEVILDNTIKFDNTSADSVPSIIFTSQLDKLTYTGDFVGNGNLNKMGSGTLILNGADTSLITGTTAIKEGTLQLGNGTTANGQLAQSDVVVYSGANLTGLTNSMGSLAIMGNVNFVTSDSIILNTSANKTAFAIYSGGLVELYMKNANEYTQYKTTDGNMEFRGGTMNVTVADNYKSEITTGTTLQAFQTENGSVNGNYSNLILTDNVQGYRLRAVERDNGLDLVFGRLDYRDNASSLNAVSFGNYMNQAAEKYGTDWIQFFNLVENQIESNHSIQEEMSGEFQLTAVNAQVLMRNMLRQTVTQNAIPKRNSNSVGNYRGQMASEESGVSGWMNVFGMSGSSSMANARNDFNYDMLEGVFGLDGGNDSAKAGIFYSYSHSNLDGDTILDNVKLDEHIFGGYLRWEDRFGYGMIYGNIGLSSYEGHRFANLPYTYDFANDHNGWNGSLYLERGYTFKLNRMDLQPYFGLQYSHFNEDGYSEENAQFQAATLTRDSFNYDSLQTILGNRVQFNTCFLNRETNVYLHTSWLHELLDDHAEASSQVTVLQNGMTPYQVIGSGLGRDWFLCGLGGQMKCNDRFQLFGGADYQINDYVSFISGNAGFKYIW